MRLFSLLLGIAATAFAADSPTLHPKATALPFPKPPTSAESYPRQEPGQRPARALPYDFDVAAKAGPDGLMISLANTGRAGAAFNLYARGGGEPRFYTVEAGKALTDIVPMDGGARPVGLEIAHNAYRQAPPRLVRLAPGAQAAETYDLKDSANWYDLVVTCVEAPSFRRRMAGHGEDGRPSLSDPLLGRQA